MGNLAKVPYAVEFMYDGGVDYYAECCPYTVEFPDDFSDYRMYEPRLPSRALVNLTSKLDGLNLKRKYGENDVESKDEMSSVMKKGKVIYRDSFSMIEKELLVKKKRK